MNILIIDDEKFIAKGLAKIVADMDKPYVEKIFWHYDALTALKMMNENSFECVITDIEMPDLNGISFIEKINKQFPNTKIIVISGYDDFKYVNAAYKMGITEYILKPVQTETLSNCIDNVHNKLSLNSQYNYYTDTKSDVQKKLYEIIYNNAYTNPQEIGKISESIEHNNFFLLATLNKTNIIETEILKFYNEILDIPFSLIYLIEQNFSSLLFSFDNETHARKAYQKIVTTKPPRKSVYINDKSYGGISSIFSNLQNIETMIQQATNASKYHILNNSYWYEYILLRENISIYPELSTVTTKLNQFLHGQDFSSAIAYIEKLFSIDNISIYQFSAIETLYYSIRNVLNSHISQQIREQYNFLPLNLYSSLDDLIVKFKKCISDLSIQSMTNQNLIKKNIVDYIENNYSKEINLATVANQLSFSYSYFSRLFTSLFNESFSSYLIKVRMKHAKELLDNTNCTVYEVAKKVGYNSSKSFSNSYKRYYGFSPKNLKK